ncbi:MAG: LLM class F420-dependent oxidoreductase [Pseudonocardia sp.]|uniref:LLM class F420-dependent oxidoreductase n=1 Tax=unclassified Pseudonocardia TaxID=2619320 RepID=UPI00086937A1|nr:MULTISPECIES: LLM class F420-dependent oxidoreductase [unclassified Pseudonocardia]MBN9112560.1 LLM class F420-dependent oxidoreductase [Pseudonocardia sp.]ODU22366.1 MAG: LLM class F420-dependent oxidoreductase [Pseudonocardia sp. SCN 72-51]ODV07055.1 MAG: LLM class F420-dependent oxidoreductase [Pseudonocardia sp. SCN 73-27]
MTVQVGRYGVWRRERELDGALAKRIEELGYGAIWIGGSPPAELGIVEAVLSATDSIAVGTSIVNMWNSPADEVARSYHRIEEAFPGRFLLGVGVGHPEATKQYAKPFDTIVDYLDALDNAGVPVEGRALAALGPKVLKVSAERTAGALPYLTTPEHTREAREILGAGRLLVAEHKVVLDTDPQRARDVGRPAVISPYLGLVNYRRNLMRLGFTEQQLDAAADEVVDAVVAHGDAAAVAARLDEHLAAGADHVCAQLLVADSGDPVPGLTELAGALGL